jgi:hypothetical protein
MTVTTSFKKRILDFENSEFMSMESYINRIVLSRTGLPTQAQYRKKDMEEHMFRFSIDEICSESTYARVFYLPYNNKKWLRVDQRERVTFPSIHTQTKTTQQNRNQSQNLFL